MTDVTALRPGVAREPLPEHHRGLGGRVAEASTTPGGAVFVLVAVLLVSTIVANPNFGDPEVLIRFLGRTAPIAIAAVGQYYVIVSGEFDLSMGAVISLQVVLAGNMIGDDAGMILPVMLLMFVLGALDRCHERVGHHRPEGAELHRDARDDARVGRHRRLRDGWRGQEQPGR